MGRMSEYAAEQEEMENLSGADLCEAWHHEQELKKQQQQVPDLSSGDKLGEQDEILR